MGQCAASEEEILLQLEGLAFDSLQVVSYKWLSRHFLISSNAAKRLLQKFADQNYKTELDVLYTLSGWSSKDPQTFSVQLVPKARLEEASATIQGKPSVHVYSVQRSLSKDPAQLWSTEFTQAESLFNESSEVNNCLRDNRFSAVSCDLVQRLSKKRPRIATPAQPSSSNGPTTSIAAAPPVPKAQAEIPLTTGQEHKLSDESAGKKQQSASTPAKAPPNKPGSSGSLGNKRAAPSAPSGSGAGSSLASMWGKAPAAKSKVTAEPVSSGRTAALKSSSTAGDAEARIQAVEAEDDSEEEDMATDFAAMRRGQYNASRGRRRVVIDIAEDDGDEDDNGYDTETVVRLGSPESPPLVPPQRNGQTDASTPDDRASKHHDKASTVSKVVPSNGTPPSSLRPNTSPKRPGTTEEDNDVNGNGGLEGNGATSSMSDAPKSSSKRKKVYKSTIDSQGREVSVCVWETETEGGQGATEDSVKLSTSREIDAKAPVVKPPPPQKPPASTKSSTSKVAGKGSTKAAGKPAKGQGSIMSFFKKT